MPNKLPKEFLKIKKILGELKKDGKILLAYLYGSFAKGTQSRSLKLYYAASIFIFGLTMRDI